MLGRENLSCAVLSFSAAVGVQSTVLALIDNDYLCTGNRLETVHLSLETNIA